MAKGEIFLTEKRKDRGDFDRTMRYTTRAQVEIDDNLIYKSMFKKVLWAMDQNSRHFLNEKRREELKKICKEVAGSIIGKYQVSVMSYEDLIYTVEHSYNIRRIGYLTRNSIFALIDEGARLVGFYIPKNQRQLIIERKIDKAISDLREYFASKGAKMNEEIGEALATFLWNQNFPYYIPNIKIMAIRHELTGVYSEIWLTHCNKLQVQYKANEGVVYYHISRN